MVYFGYPQAHEDDAQRAVHAALGMLEALRQLNGRLQSAHRLQVAVRIGIHTGLAVVSAIGMGANAQPLTVGETPHIAAQLQELAAPDGRAQCDHVSAGARVFRVSSLGGAVAARSGRTD
jgi:class 3 adenylate cyclase